MNIYFTVPFNNTRTLQFKTQLKIAFFTEVNQEMDRNLPITTPGLGDLLNPLK